MKKDPVYRVSFTERWNIADNKFSHSGRHAASTIIECLESIAVQAMTMSHHDDGAYGTWTKKKTNGEYVNRIDYRDEIGHLKMDQHNPAVLTLKGHWGGIAQSDNHVAAYISIDICFGAPMGEGITDLDAYQILTWLYVRNYNVMYEQLPGKRYWWRESNTTEKSNAQGMKFPPSFERPQ
tara:strand:- start:2403 stop:2942 length:540 start_codon:yes stop_codon:yes gene_type:complete